MLDQAQKLRDMAVGNASVKAPKVITVTSGKGGVGKSNFVVNLSIALQKMGKSVLIFDADVGMGNDDILMGYLPKYNVFDIINKNMNIEDVIIQGPSGVRLLPGGSGMNKIEEFTTEQREEFLSKITSLNNVDYIIMDTGAGINRSVLGFIACCNELIVITTPEPTSLTDAYSLLKVVNHFKLKKDAQVVVNRVIDIEEGRNTFEKFNNAVNSFLKIKLSYLGYITEDKRLIQAVRQQEPFTIKYPNCNAAVDIQKIALRLMGSQDQSNNIGVQGFFRKIFSIFS
jgi:flagellar biosynthesis protein FlhG